MYDKFGFGLWHAARKRWRCRRACAGCSSATSCPTSTSAMPSCRSSGGRDSPIEAAAATVRHGAQKFGLARVIGVVSEGNAGSIRVLEKLGMSFERMFAMREGEPAGAAVRPHLEAIQRRVTDSPMTLPIFPPWSTRSSTGRSKRSSPSTTQVAQTCTLMRVVLAPAPVVAVVLLDVNAAEHARAVGELDVAIARDDLAARLRAPLISISPDTVDTSPPTRVRLPSSTLPLTVEALRATVTPSPMSSEPLTVFHTRRAWRRLR